MSKMKKSITRGKAYVVYVTVIAIIFAASSAIYFMHIGSGVSVQRTLSTLNLSDIEAIFPGGSYTALELNNTTSLASNLYSSNYISLSTSLFSSLNKSVNSTYPTQILSLVFLMNSTHSAENAVSTSLQSANLTSSLSGYGYINTYSTEYKAKNITTQIYLVRSVGVFNFTSQLNSTTLKYLNMPVYEYTLLFNYKNLFCDITVYAYTENLSDSQLLELPKVMLNKLALKT